MGPVADPDAPVGRVTGIGSWPGTDVPDAARTAFGELGEAPHLPHLVELPARGPGADLVGRGAALLVDLPVDLQPSGWRLVDHPGRDHARALSYLRHDLDVLAEVADAYQGDLKVQVAGPWTLAANLRLARLERAVADLGACRDLVASLAEGVARHVAEVRRLVPGARVVLQLDEPSLPAVLTGALTTVSGFGRLRPVEEPVVIEGLRAVLDSARAAGATLTVVHSCAAEVPIPALVRAGVQAVSLDVALLAREGWEAVAAAVEQGVALWAGVRTGPPEEMADAVWTRWRRLGLDSARAASVVLTPPCGLAGAASPSAARAVVAQLARAASVLAERSAG